MDSVGAGAYFGKKEIEKIIFENFFENFFRKIFFEKFCLENIKVGIFSSCFY